MSDFEHWPAITFSDWQDTAAALHLYSQIVGKYRLAHSPWVNHSWHATLYVTPRGLSTSPIPDGNGALEISFDFHDHVLRGECASGNIREFPLQPMSVADFHAQFSDVVRSLNGIAEFHGTPNELPEVTPFTEDTAERPYDRVAVERFHRALVSISHVFQEFRTGFIGKVSPVHLFWGSFDLAVTRFSGRPAPLHPGGFPNLPDSVTQEAYSHEVSSAGFWAGGGPVDDAAFYAYAYPQPDGFADAKVAPDSAWYDKDFSEFILMYESVRQSDDPASTLMQFLQTTYDAAATLGNWEKNLSRPPGPKGRPFE